ncbi:MAG: hypothetical protein IJ197_02270 [Bacteroidaceae bacterium]|nr:hypothetical protein [Bacteroidaceae bacterium]
MNTVSLNSLWSYLQSLSLTASNKKWLADHLYESVEEANDTVDETGEQLQSPSRAYIENGEVKVDIVSETMGIEEARALLHKVIDLEYSLP